MGDPIVEAYIRLAYKVFDVLCRQALRGDVADRLFLMSIEGEAFMIELGLDPCAARAALVDEWRRAGIQRVVRRRPAGAIDISRNFDTLRV